MYERDLPMWSEDMWNAKSEQAKNWQQYAEILRNFGSFVVVAAEWAGAIPVSLRNFILHTSFKEMAHKPAMIVSVSASGNGVYPISELKSYSAKNNGLLYIPDHVIVRDAGEVLDNNEMDELDKNDFWIKERINFSIANLELYTKNMKNLRAEADFDLEKYSFEM